VSHTIKPTHGGYLPFATFPSDHCCLWIDITTYNAFGYQPPKSTRYSARQLKSDNPSVWKKWLVIYEKHICMNKLHTRQFQLESQVQHQMTEA
jgi:hypothetical protein